MTHPNLYKGISSQVNDAVRRLISEVDRNPYSATYGCFDRRYWSWKLVDFPEATFQRNVHSLALLYSDQKSQHFRSPIIRVAIEAGLNYTASLQHQDGSFDQAFPHERSFGATAFLLHSLSEAFKIIESETDSQSQKRVERCLSQAAEFLCKHDERHGHIANHLAGAALALLNCADYFRESRYRQRAEVLLDLILKNQSPEGWFLEYEGADPGYQTLCLYYLAQIYQKLRGQELKESLERAVKFIAYFVHPDGTFGGEYGSRRTAVFYPGGLALLSRGSTLALSITRSMFHSISASSTVTLRDIDMGNLAPLLSNYVCALQAGVLEKEEDSELIPWERSKVRQDFSRAGLFVRGKDNYYAVFGASNGGVLKVFDKQKRQILWDDSGYIGKLGDGTLVTTQITKLNRSVNLSEDEILLESDFYKALHLSPTPMRFVLLRLINLTLMRSVRLGNMIKKRLVNLLISGKHPYAMSLKRKVRFEERRVIVEDQLIKPSGDRVKWMDFGLKFVSIHMASAGYFEGWKAEKSPSVPKLDVARLNEEGNLDVRVVIESTYA
jgi:hypothetical protein